MAYRDRRRSPVAIGIVVVLILIALVVGAFFIFGGEASVDDGEVDITVPEDLETDEDVDVEIDN